MNEPRGSRILGAVLLVVIIAVVFIGLWAFMSMAFVTGGVPNGDVVFTIGAILLGAVAVATAVWLIRLVRDRNAAAEPSEEPAVPPSEEGTPAAS
jgi:hypothetical protein